MATIFRPQSPMEVVFLEDQKQPLMDGVILADASLHYRPWFPRNFVLFCRGTDERVLLLEYTNMVRIVEDVAIGESKTTRTELSKRVKFLCMSELVFDQSFNPNHYFQLIQEFYDPEKLYEFAKVAVWMPPAMETAFDQMKGFSGWFLGTPDYRRPLKFYDGIMTTTTLRSWDMHRQISTIPLVPGAHGSCLIIESHVGLIETIDPPGQIDPALADGIDAVEGEVRKQYMDQAKTEVGIVFRIIDGSFNGGGKRLSLLDKTRTRIWDAELKGCYYCKKDHKSGACAQLAVSEIHRMIPELADDDTVHW